MELINLTPHPITVVGEDGEVRTIIPPSGVVARVETGQTVVGQVCGIPVVRTVFGVVEGLPWQCSNCRGNPNVCEHVPDLQLTGKCLHQEPQKVFIVSSMVAQAVAFREDVVAPDTSPQSAVRDEQGRIVGVKRFQRW